FDHANGNSVYREAFPSAAIVSHAFTREKMAQNFEKFDRATADAIASDMARIDAALQRGTRRDGTPLSDTDREDLAARRRDAEGAPRRGDRSGRRACERGARPRGDEEARRPRGVQKEAGRRRRAARRGLRQLLRLADRGPRVAGGEGDARAGVSGAPLLFRRRRPPGPAPLP